MHSFFAYTNRANPGLHLWREGTSVTRDLRPVAAPDGSGWVEFQCDLDASTNELVRLMLFSYDDNDDRVDFEKREHRRVLSRSACGEMPHAVWFAEGAARVVESDPRLNQRNDLRVHLISQSKFRPAEMFIWDAFTGKQRRIAQVGEDDLGPIFELALQPHEQSFFNFKFAGQTNDGFTAFELEISNRLWVANDGPEIWMHSNTAMISSSIPEMHTLSLHFRQALDSPAKLRLWAENGDYQIDVSGTPEDDGWVRYESELYTQLPYGCQFWNPDLPENARWEHAEAKRREIVIASDDEYWTLEGDNHLFSAPPSMSAELHLKIDNSDLSKLKPPLFAHVWVNRARAPLATMLPVMPDPDSLGQVSLNTFPNVVTSVKFHDADERWERVDRHPVYLEASGVQETRHVVLERPPLLKSAPADDLVADPPFTIKRPGCYADGDALRFVVHSPQTASMDLIGEWTKWLTNPHPMQSTLDGSYWWASVPIADVIAGLADGRTDYHGVKYQFRFNQESRLQDPAAGWVEDSDVRSASRIVRSDHYAWTDQHWHRPGWESLIIYQLHPSRFTNRFQNEPPLRRIAREIEDNAGYIKQLGVTAIQLMPVNEVGSSNSWGYDPAYFYAIEREYCGDDGPDELKRLVDTCHEHGMAVILDVVFNHTGSIDNVLWQVARDSFFDGDTKWGAMINFDHPQCRHFFAENLVYLANEFHIDGFRLDHTGTIVHSHHRNEWSSNIRELGTGGGWEFLHSLRHAVVGEVGPDCILTAEHLPNEWPLTNFGGPMDSQWGDDFHDRMVDACRREFGMSRLADACQLSHTASDDWYKVVNYPESHDEVGNVRDRIAFVAGFGQGWRMSKVAAACTLMSRGIPLFFMGAESGEDKQFKFGSTAQLQLDEYLSNPDRGRIRNWWRKLCELRRDSSIQGPSPIHVRLAEGQLLAFTRGASDDFYVLLNFGGWSGHRSLASLNLPHGEFRELWNSTWPDFSIHSEDEGEHTNGGRSARLHRNRSLDVPDYGAVILQRA